MLECTGRNVLALSRRTVTKYLKDHGVHYSPATLHYGLLLDGDRIAASLFSEIFKTCELNVCSEEM
jgi:hypothetical protein